MDRSEQEIVDGLRNSAPMPSAALKSRVLDAAMADRLAPSRSVMSRARFSFRTGSGSMRYAAAIAGLLVVYGATIGALDAQQRSLLEAGSGTQGAAMAGRTTAGASRDPLLPSEAPGWDRRERDREGAITLQSLEARSRTMTELLSPSLGEDHRSDQHGTI